MFFSHIFIEFNEHFYYFKSTVIRAKYFFFFLSFLFTLKYQFSDVRAYKLYMLFTLQFNVDEIEPLNERKSNWNVLAELANGKRKKNNEAEKQKKKIILWNSKFFLIIIHQLLNRYYRRDYSLMHNETISGTVISFSGVHN